MCGTDDSRSSEQHDEPAHEHAVEPSSGSSSESQGDEHPDPPPASRDRKRRRVTTAPPEGSDPHPTGEPERHPVNENDERLKGDKPPHWG